MVRGGKAREARSKRSTSSRLKGDRISQLPDPLISQILSHLPIEDAVKTSVLSTRWRNLWLWVPRMRLDYRDLSGSDAFVSIGDRFFGSESVSCVDKLELTVSCIDKHSLTFDKREDGYIRSWVDAAAKRKLRHLHLRYHAEYFDSTGKRFIVFYRKMPLSLYTCETLVSLNLSEMTLPDAEFVSLPCLKTMRLNRIWFPDEATFERLVLSCPVLEELTVVGSLYVWDAIFRVLSRSLRKLRIGLQSCCLDSGTQVVIDAPLLGFLSIQDNLSESFIVKNMHPNARLQFGLASGIGDFDESEVLSKGSMIRDFLPGISGIKEMIICTDTFKIICLYSKLEPVPQFRNMSLLHATIYATDMKWLPTFLESCPNLKSLI